MDLALKGTPLFSYDFGKVIAWEVIPEMESEKLQKLYNDNLAHQGYSFFCLAVRTRTCGSPFSMVANIKCESLFTPFL